MAFINRSTALLAGLDSLPVGGAGETYRQADAHKQQERQGADEVVHGVGIGVPYCRSLIRIGRDSSPRLMIFAYGSYCD
jgi:hypothetical protein